MSTGDWRDSSACRNETSVTAALNASGIDPEPFRKLGPALFDADPDRSRTRFTERAEVAKAVCSQCPVQATCLETGMRQEVPSERFGIWGGKLPEERMEEAERTKLFNRKKGVYGVGHALAAGAGSSRHVPAEGRSAPTTTQGVEGTGISSSRRFSNGRQISESGFVPKGPYAGGLRGRRIT